MGMSKILTVGVSFLILLLPLTLWGQLKAPQGWELYLKMGSSSTGDLVLNGGRFDGQLSHTAIVSATPFYNLWCVDAQLYFNWGASYRANSLGFQEINGESTTHSGAQQPGPNNAPWTAGDRDVRYEDVLGYASPNPSGVDNFRQSLGLTLTGSAFDGALFRYRMAGYLLDQYEAKSANLGTTAVLALNDANYGLGKYDPKDSTRNQSIIKAIWRAMDTDFDTDDQGSANTNTLFWFNTAATYVNANWDNASLWQKWGVVSAWVNTCTPGSTSPCYVRNNGDRVQTFLTEIPEPGFYGLLSVGLSALFWTASRRRKNGAAAI